MPRDPLSALDPLSDDALLVLYAQGDAEAARVLTGRHLGRVYGFAARLLGDRTEAEAVAQEVMVRLWRGAGQWRPGEAQLSSWLYRVTANLCTDHQRARRDEREGQEDRRVLQGAEPGRERGDDAAGGSVFGNRRG